MKKNVRPVAENPAKTPEEEPREFLDKACDPAASGS